MLGLTADDLRTSFLGAIATITERYRRDSPLRAEDVKETLPGNEVYQGEKVGDMRHGRGRVVYADGHIYEGGFAFDVRDGFGTLSFNDKVIYEGEWRNGLFHGKGRLERDEELSENPHIDPLNLGEDLLRIFQSYEGEFSDGRFNGMGTLILVDGTRVWGQFFTGKVSGLARVQPNGGEEVFGEWLENRFVGNL
eukprot:TRINITY_DN6606_c0_g1_i1.p1 TRINITY_DN6606_c0_g1~~TRINITY_DN6606_c0_g1_i1.p1  ORF type:complete len:194 (+),score=46.73 TRINITY_DN6606_c0_g1_i1:98-679(+)